MRWTRGIPTRFYDVTSWSYVNLDDPVFDRLQYAKTELGEIACTRLSWQKVNHVSVPTLIIQVRVLRFCSMRLECFSLKCNGTKNILRLTQEYAVVWLMQKCLYFAAM